MYARGHTNSTIRRCKIVTKPLKLKYRLRVLVWLANATLIDFPIPTKRMFVIRAYATYYF